MNNAARPDPHRDPHASLPPEGAFAALGRPGGDSGRYAIHPMYLFRWEPSQTAHVLLYPEGIVKLNETAGEILKRCDGARTVDQLIAELQALYPDEPARVEAGVLTFLEVFRAKGWIRRQT